MDPLDRVREAIAKGVRGKELQKLFKALIEGAESIPEEDYIQFVQEVVNIDPEISKVYANAQEDARPGLESAAMLLPGAAGLSAVRGAGSAATVLSKTTAEGVKEIVAKNPTLIRSVLEFMRRHPRMTRLGVGAGILGGTMTAGAGLIQGIEETDPNAQAGLNQGSGSSAGETEVRRNVGGLVEPEVKDHRKNPAHGYNVMVIDRDGSMTGTPGSVVVLRPEDLDPALGRVNTGRLDEIIGSLDSSPGGSAQLNQIISAAVTGSLSGAGVNPVQAGLVQPLATIAPQTVGSVTISSPVQAGTVGSTIPLPADMAGDRPVAGSPFDPRYLEVGAPVPGAPAASVKAEPVTIPAGSEIAPRVFNEFRGRTLLEWASVAAQRHGVPLNLLYGIVDHESNWNPNAVGDNGNSFGLAQIYLPVWGGQVSAAQARNPAFALEWAAKNLKANFQKYGRWDAAVAAHNSPVAAQHLASTGGFQNKKSAAYVSDVFSRANRSGVDNAMFDLDPDMTVGPQGGGGARTTYTPYQSPDPAQAREFIEQEYQNLLGRSPTEKELTAGVQRINALSQQSYQANLRQAKGGGSQAVDVEAQFREGIRGTGEFAFTEDTHELESFTDYAAGVARLLQQGL